MIHTLNAALLGGVILAHGWYPQRCCGDSHCHPVGCDQLIEQPNGDVVLAGTLIRVPAAEVKASPDRRCHLCVIAGMGVCAWIQYGT